MNETLAAQIMDFLRNKDVRELRYRWREYTVLLLKSAYDADTEFLYSTYTYQSPDAQRIGNDAKYMGVYSHSLDKVIGNIEGLDSAETMSFHTITEGFIARVKSRVEEIVDNQPVCVTDEAAPCRDERQYYLDHGADREARGLFYGENKAPQYKAYVAIEDPSTATLVQILHHPDEVIEEYAKRHITEHARRINERLWQIGIVTERLRKLNDTPGEHHLRKAIARCIDTNTMKMVGIGIEKDGQCMSGKIEAFELTRADDTDYSTYRMDAPTRRDFERMFGRNARLLSSDITRITYGRKVLYEKA